MADQFRQVGITYSVKKLDYTEFNSQLIGSTFPDRPAQQVHASRHRGGHLLLQRPALEVAGQPRPRERLPDRHLGGGAADRTRPREAKDLLKIWTQYHDQAYRPVRTFGRAFNVQQPWVRGVRLESAFGARSYFYDWGEILVKAWLDK
ncbi:MAG: hypothetical protein U0446_04320 [Dehalococcoidia bacterium]